MIQPFLIGHELTTFNHNINEIFLNKIFRSFIKIVIFQILNNMTEHLAHLFNQSDVLALDAGIDSYQLRNVQLFDFYIGGFLIVHKQVVDHADQKNEYLLLFWKI